MKAIILKKNLFSEGNEIITMYTREFGKIRGLARSVKSAKSKLAFGLQNMFYTEVEMAQARNLPPITGVKVVNSFKNLRENLKDIYCAYHATEIILKSTADEQPNHQLWDLYLSYLEHLDQAETAPDFKHHNCVNLFTFRALDFIGYGANLKTCASCSKILDLEKGSYFSNRRGGLLCEDCQNHASDAKKISSKLLSVLMSDSSSFEAADALEVNFEELHSLGQSWAKHILERDLNAGKYLL